jgi:predicted Zn-dependent peptidase
MASVIDVPSQIRALTSNDIPQAAERYLDTTRYVKVILMPQK